MRYNLCSLIAPKFSTKFMNSKLIAVVFCSNMSSFLKCKRFIHNACMMVNSGIFQHGLFPNNSHIMKNSTGKNNSAEIYLEPSGSRREGNEIFPSISQRFARLIHAFFCWTNYNSLGYFKQVAGMELINRVSAYTHYHLIYAHQPRSYYSPHMF